MFVVQTGFADMFFSPHICIFLGFFNVSSIDGLPQIFPGSNCFRLCISDERKDGIMRPLLVSRVDIFLDSC